MERIYEPQYVTELDSASTIQLSDLFLISLKLLNDTLYVSRKISVKTFLDSLFNNLNTVSLADFNNLSALVYANTIAIKDMQDKVDKLISCVVKMANCILTNKSNISDLSSNSCTCNG